MAIKKKSPSTVKPKAVGLTDNQRWGYGFILLFFALFIAASVVSFFIYWREDQDIALWSNVFNGTQQQVLNWGGKLGAFTANIIVNKWFGLFGFCIPMVLIILALRIMRYRPTMLRKSVRLTTILMILGSLSLGYLFGDRLPIFGSGLGGAHGIFVARWLNSVLGVIGTGLLLLLSIVIFAVYINRNTISLINRMGKGLADNSMRVGGKVGKVVASTASSVLSHGDDRVDHSCDERDEDVVLAAENAATVANQALNQAANSSMDEFGVQGVDNHPHSTAASPEAVVDDDGFIITNLSEDPVSEFTTIEQAPYHEEVDENGFIIQYALGDQEPVLPDGISGAESASGLEFSYGQKPFTAPSAPPIGDTSPLNGDGIDRVPLYDDIGGDSFVASVPQGIPLNEQNGDVVIERLPEDKLLSDSEIENVLYDPSLDLSTYQRPPLELLEDHKIEVSVTSEEIVENKNRIKDTLENFGIKIDKIKATIGPTVTLYEIVPAPGVRISKIKNLEDDIALSLSALGIRIIAPIPGKGTIGIEVPNKDKKIVSMYSVIKSAKFQESTYDLPVVLGKTIQDETFVIDLAKMPHLLVAGATGQGKSVGLNAIITSLLYKNHPSQLKLVLVDPKKVELTLYSKLERHFLAKMEGEDDAIITDTHKVIYTLNSICIEMDARYDLLRKAEVRQIKEYNHKFIHRKLNPNKGHRYLPYIVVIIDEFADLIMTAGREVETPLARIAQLARAVGIHLVIATQRPTTNIITGVIKANFPARIAFRVTSMIDSRTIIDQPGANQLIGRGDMLVSTGSELMRVQCAFVDTPEIERITEFISNQRGYVGAYELPDYSPDGASDTSSVGNKNNDLSQLDAMFEDVSRFVVQNQQGSTSSIQRRFSIGYNRAGRIMDQLEMAGVVGRAEGSKPREVLVQDMLSLEKVLSGLL